MLCKRRQNYPVVEGALKQFPLKRLRSLIAANGMEDVKNAMGQRVLPLIDKKIVYKMAYIWKLLSEEDQRRCRTYRDKVLIPIIAFFFSWVEDQTNRY
jgi:hypothetical protein